MNSVLSSFRLYHDWKQEDIASALSLTVEEYCLLEDGEIKIQLTVAKKLSDIYNAPVEFFLFVSHSAQFNFIYSHNTFINSNGYVNRFYQDSERLIDMINSLKDEQVIFLKEEIERLRKQNDKLVAELVNKINT